MQTWDLLQNIKLDRCKFSYLLDKLISDDGDYAFGIIYEDWKYAATHPREVSAATYEDIERYMRERFYEGSGANYFSDPDKYFGFVRDRYAERILYDFEDDDRSVSVIKFTAKEIADWARCEKIDVMYQPYPDPILAGIWLPEYEKALHKRTLSPSFIHLASKLHVVITPDSNTYSMVYSYGSNIVAQIHELACTPISKSDCEVLCDYLEWSSHTRNDSIDNFVQEMI